LSSSGTKLHQRFFFLFLAILFFCTAFALSFLVIWQGHQNSNAQKAAKAQANESTCLTTKPNPADINVKKKGVTLQSSQLADFTPCKVSKLESIDVSVGSGPAVTSTDTITVDYTGAVAATGTIFQSSLDTGQPATFPLNQVIPGWTQGIPGMKVGGVRRLLIPAALAYAGSPPQGSGIPANADLVFDITLHKIGS
jgi:FKBP-type peptidyl-prolyl cis-trans isomerase